MFVPLRSRRLAFLGRPPVVFVLLRLPFVFRDAVHIPVVPRPVRLVSWPPAVVLAVVVVVPVAADIVGCVVPGSSFVVHVLLACLPAAP